MMGSCSEHGDEGLESVKNRLKHLFLAPSASSPFDTSAPSSPSPSTSPAVSGEVLRTKLQEAVDIRGLLSRNTEELDSVIRWGSPSRHE